MEEEMKLKKKLNKPMRKKFLLLISQDILEKTHIIARQRFMSTTAYITEVLIKNLAYEKNFGNV